MSTSFPFYHTTFGKILRAILFVPIGFFVSATVLYITKTVFNIAGNWFGGLILSSAFALIAGMTTSISIYPGTNKKIILLVFFLLFILITLAYIYLVITNEDYSSNRGWFKGLMHWLGSLIGYYVVYKEVVKDESI